MMTLEIKVHGEKCLLFSIKVILEQLKSHMKLVALDKDQQRGRN